MMQKKVAVTGGAGFIGSYLTERLLRDGHKVIVLDNLSTGRLSNLNGVEANPNFSFFNADITKIKKLLGWKTEILFEDGVKTLLEERISLDAR